MPRRAVRLRVQGGRGSEIVGVTVANKTRSSFEKRQKEVSRQQRQKSKQAKRLEAKQKGVDGEPDSETPEVEEDPDLAGIVLGPQPTAGDDDGLEDDDDRPGDDEKP